ncbi:MAG: PBSX family phage terminase large subunit [Clostridia bacterium]|nr:PBSX family phage terminase large subunit [Clostridia bacterium]
MGKTATIPWGAFSDKHKRYIKEALKHRMCVAEGAIRSGKTIDHCIIAAAYLERTPDRFHLASGATIANAKLNIGVCNGFGLENLFRGRCRWGKYRDNEALFIRTHTGEKIVIFAGGGRADSYRRILGNSYGLWIATEINEHYDCADSRTSFVKVASGRQIAARQPLTLWDLNPCGPGAPIYRDYIDKYRKDRLAGGYLYEHFTIRDNATITPERLREIESRYDVNSVWYRRDILGERAAAEGLIYRQFADNPERFIVDGTAEGQALPGRVRSAAIGVDFGGGTSAHAFCCLGFTAGGAAINSPSRPATVSAFAESHGIVGNSSRGAVVVLDEYRQGEALTPNALAADFVEFVQRCQARWLVTDVWCDSAEQTLINGLRAAAAAARLPVNIGSALKKPINDRIRATCLLMGEGRFFVHRDCRDTIDALLNAVWDRGKPTQDVRLDDGTTNIDSLDAMEYALEREIAYLL